MKIEIKDEDDILTLDNENLDNHNYVDLFVQSGKEEVAIMVNIDQLSAAVSSFVELRKLELERSKLYE